MAMGVDYVLTSGGKHTALDGSEIINKMVQLASDKLTVIAAGKITKSNLTEHIEAIGTKEFHGQSIVGNLK
jgi:copper homeostasis protein